MINSLSTKKVLVEYETYSFSVKMYLISLLAANQRLLIILGTQLSLAPK